MKADAGFEIQTFHAERRPGFRGIIDLLLRRKPIIVIDQAGLYHVSIRTAKQD